MTNPFSLDEFEAFCRSKPEGETYPRMHSGCCALAQFGFPKIGGFVTAADAGISHDVFHATVLAGPSTFGALADRLAKLREREDA